MDIKLKHGTARVDASDADRIRGFTWYSMLTRQGCAYAYTAICGRKVYMHHLVLNHATNGRGGGDIDHINGDGLDNRRANLRRATRQQNSANQRPRGGASEFKGVSWCAKAGVWQAHITVDYKSVGLGLYEQEVDAARAYDIAAVEAWGKFARINFPDRLNEPAPIKFSAKMKAREMPLPLAAPTARTYKSGETNPNAKLTEDEVRRIIKELQSVPRRAQSAIANEFGISTTMVSLISRRKSWSHLWGEK